MTARQTYVVACLAGHGIGPEITAAASRALARLGREHGFDVEELHPPFDTEALTRSGHTLPRATRQATASADAVLVAGRRGSGARRASGPRSTSARRSTASSTTPARQRRSRRCTTPRRAGRSSGRSRPHGPAPAGSPRSASTAAWRSAVDRHADRHPGVEVEHVPLPEALRTARGRAGRRARRRGRARRDASPRRRGSRASGGSSRPASSRRPGPGLFAPAQGTASDLAGQGVADPSSMLLATALLLLARASAARPPARRSRTASRWRSAHRDGRRRCRAQGVAATTREFVDAVLGLLPSARRDTEFALGAAR